MRKISLFIFLLLLCSTASAEIIRLKTGKVLEGEILLRNEQVVVFRETSGARYQYPMSEVEYIGQPDGKTRQVEPATTTSSAVVKTESTERKAQFRLELAGGLGVMDKSVGGAMAVDALVGSRRIAGREMMIGGAIGYHGIWASGQAMHFLPIQLVLRYTILPGTHSPYIGVGLGYGVALQKSYVGGIYSGLDLGYRYLTPRHHKQICVGLYGAIQGCRMTTEESVPDDDSAYIHARAGRMLGQFGLKFSIGL